MGEWAEDHAEEIAQRANEVIATLRVPKPSAERVDYRLAKRAVEHAAASLFPDAESVDARAAVVLRDPKFVSLGLDLVKDALEGDEDGDQIPEWSVDAEMVKSIVGNRPSLWKFLANELAKEDAIKQRGLPYDLRVELTERLATWLTRKEVSFIADVLGAARRHGIDLDLVSGREMLGFVDTFWTRSEGREWVQRIREFVGYFLSRTPTEQRVIVEDSLTTGQFVRETTEGVSRERLRAAFNTTLYPMILLANEVMQEGLDLHRNCRRIVHHDLAWNPAQLEQRVGRIDRLGSLVHRLRARPSTSGATIDVLYPLVERTIDERLYRTVKDREKWLELMLGARPTLAEDPAGEPPPPLPAEIAERLRVDLTPRGGE